MVVSPLWILDVWLAAEWDLGLRTPGCSGFGGFGWEEGFDRGVNLVDGNGLLGQWDFVFGDGVW